MLGPVTENISLYEFWIRSNRTLCVSEALLQVGGHDKVRHVAPPSAQTHELHARSLSCGFNQKSHADYYHVP